MPIVDGWPADRAGGAILGTETALRVELVLGIVNDFQFGPFLLVGLGGIFVEVLRDTRLLKPPTDPATIEAALIAYGHGVVAVDALIVPRSSAG